MSYLAIANFKMNGTVASALNYGNQLFDKLYQEELKKTRVILAPPDIHISYLQSRLIGTPVIFSGQNINAFTQAGAYTGDISAAMPKDLGCQYVLIGHSERRHYYQEDNTLIQQKIKLVLAAALIPILCIGESLEEYQAGFTLNVIEKQLAECLYSRPDNVSLIIAYEPVWAIGTGKVPQVVEVATVINFIATYLEKNHFQADLVYGGSVKEDNAPDFLGIDSLKGFLVGGASLNVETFWPIIKACEAA